MLSLGRTCLSIPCWSAKCPYGSLAPSPHAADQFDDLILICGIASHFSRRIRRRSCILDATHRLHSWFHNCSIGFRSVLHAGHYSPGICLACRWFRTILAIWGRKLNQDKCLWTWQWNCETWAMRSFFRLSAFMSFILCMEKTNKWLIAPLYTELTQMKLAFGTFHYRPHPVLRLLAGAMIIWKLYLLF